MLTRLWSNAWTDYAINDGNPNYLELSRFNIFIGPNNSGKSRFLRSIVTLEDDSARFASDQMQIVHVNNFLNVILPYIPDGHTLDDINSLWVQETVVKGVYDKHDRNLIRDLPKFKHRVISGNQNGQVPRLGELRTILRNESIDDETCRPFIATIPQRIYIPILRGMRPVSLEEVTDEDHYQESKLFYIHRTNKDYPQITKDRIYTGEKIFQILKEHLLGQPDQRDSVRDYEKQISNYFFDGKKVTLIPRLHRDVVDILIEGEDQHPIYDVGDGLQQVIITTFTAFFTHQESIICLEEPEISLHPGLIRQLVKFLIEVTKHQYFVTTHSNHLLDFHDQSNKCSLFKITKSVADKKFHIHKIGKDRSILFDLGVKSSSVFISNCTIWVEGITDRLYIREYLKKYYEKNSIEPYIENYHYSFVEYQGSNITHWDFDDQDEQHSKNLKAIKITSQPLVIADGDVAGKKNRINKLKDELGDSFYLLKGKEIENYLPLDAVKYTAHALFQKFTRKKYKTDINTIDSLSYSEYKRSAEGLGNHIDRAIGCNLEKEQRIFSTKSTTLSDKMDFCQLSTEFMSKNDWELTPEINELCEKIVNHIQKHNS